MAEFDIKGSSTKPRGRFGSRQDPGTVQVPGQNTGNSKLAVKEVDNRSIEEKDVASSLFAPPKEDDLGPQFKHRRRKRNEVSVFEEQMDQRFGMDSRAKKSVVLGVVLVLTLLVALILPGGFFSVNSTNTSLASLLAGIANNVQGFLNYFSGESPTDPMKYKLFRYLVIALAGAALGISGGVYQGALKNALASPTTLGVISGGTLGAMLYVIFLMPSVTEQTSYTAADLFSYYDSLSPFEYFSIVYGQVACSLLGCFVVVAFVILVATIAGKGKVSNPVLIITGQVVATVMASVMTLIRLYYSSSNGDAVTASALSSVRSNSFSSLYTALDLLLIGVPVLLCVAVIVALRLRMNVLTFSDEEARSMGISTNLTRNVMVGACTVMTAVIVAFCGSIGFVGFIVPHLTRKVVGPDFMYYIPATALVGAVFMVFTSFASSFFYFDDFGGIRLLTSIIGGVAFIVIALNGRRGGTSDGF